MAAKTITVTGDDKDELIAELQAWLEILGVGSEEPETEVEVEEETEGEPEEEAVEEESEEDKLRSKLVDKIRAMSKKPDQVQKIRDAFKKVGIKKLDDETPDKKLPLLAKALGVK